MRLSTALLPGLLLALASPSLARADVPPSPDYVEQCTVAKEQGPGTECIDCGDAYHGDRDACEKHTADGYARRCRTSGASVWHEVWCRPSAAPKPSPEAAPQPATGADKAATPAAPEAAPQPVTGADKAATPAAPEAAGGKAGGGGCSVVAGGHTDRGWLLAVVGLALAGSRRRR